MAKMKTQKTTLTVEIEYNPRKTDPEGLACAMDRLLETALSTPDIMDEYGNPTVGEFFVAKETAVPSGTEGRLEPFRWRLAGRIWFGPGDCGGAGGLGRGRLQSVRQRHCRASRRARRHTIGDTWSSTPCGRWNNLRARKPKRR